MTAVATTAAASPEPLGPTILSGAAPNETLDTIPSVAVATLLTRISDGPLAVVPNVGHLRYGVSGARFKRVIDVVVSATMLVLLAPLLAAIALAVRLTSPGPALFRQTRVGFAERPFTMWKFRTMRADCDDRIHREFMRSMLRDPDTSPDTSPDTGAGSASDDGSEVFKLVDDPRITRIGAFLRRTSLDELPQLINVLRGEMSLVGPRPCLYYELEEYQPHHRMRATSMPGMTGLWQVDGRSAVHPHQALDMDLTYIKTCSLWSDLVLLVRTIRVFISSSAF